MFCTKGSEPIYRRRDREEEKRGRVRVNIAGVNAKPMVDLLVRVFYLAFCSHLYCLVAVHILSALLCLFM